MTKKYFLVKGLNNEEREFVSLCKSKDMIEAITMYRDRGLSVTSITFLKQARNNDEYYGIDSIRYSLDEREASFYIRNRMNNENHSISAINIGKYNYDNIIDTDIEYYVVQTCIPIQIFPTINRKSKGILIESGIIIKTIRDKDKLYFNVPSTDLYLYVEYNDIYQNLSRLYV